MNETILVKEKRTSGNGSVRDFLQKLSRGLMIPIALLPVAGLFLGIGAGWINIYNTVGMNSVDNAGAYVLPTVMKAIGDIIFGNLPILFCVAVAIAFTDDAGVAGFSALVGWIVFNAFQAQFIYAIEGTDDAFNILFYENVPSSVVTSNIGIQSLQTSVFGGMTVGFVTAYLYNKFHTFEMPVILGFFSGTRLVPIMVFLAMPIFAAIFLLIWPICGIGLNALGMGLANMPAGTNSLLFGIIERALIPFGLHHAFYTPLWFTSAGGQAWFYDSAGELIASGEGDEGVWFAFMDAGMHFDSTINLNNLPPGVVAPDNILALDQNAWDIYYYDPTPLNPTSGDEIWGQVTAGIKPGEYMQGKYPFMNYGLPAAGLAMILAAKKENREVVTSIIGSAALTAFLTGITEPIEFTFLFLAPFLYYGFHVWMCGISFWLMNLLGANVGMTFGGGFIDYTLYGLLPMATGFHNRAWIVPIIGIVYIPIYFSVFYFYITKFDIKTPGRADGDEEGFDLVTKADYQAAKKTKNLVVEDSLEDVRETNGIDPKTGIKLERSQRVQDILEAVGGFENITLIGACISRLRLSIVDKDKINEKRLKQLGAFGVIIVGKNAVHIVFGAESDRIKVDLQLYKKYLKLK